MSYLEDFMDYLNELPPDMRNCLKEISKLDSQVEDSMKLVKDNVEELFSNADQLDSSELETLFHTVMEEGGKAITKSTMKIDNVVQIKNKLAKYLSQLDFDLQKLKEKLNTENEGTAELIEQRVSNEEKYSHTKERKKKYRTKRYVKDQPTTSNSFATCKGNFERLSIVDSEAERVDLRLTTEDPKECTKNNKQIDKTVKPNGGSKKTKSRSISKKNISEDIELPSPVLFQEPIECTSSAFLNGQFEHESNPIKINIPKLNVNSIVSPKKNKRKKTKSKKSSNHETRYCICNEVAYDLMVACDNDTCPIEWFHYDCVGITEKPIGNWYCDQCTEKMKN